MGQSTRRLSGLPIDLQGNVNPGHPFDRGARFELLIECTASNREVMARSGFMEVESSPLALQARGPKTGFGDVTRDVLEPDHFAELPVKYRAHTPLAESLWGVPTAKMQCVNSPDSGA